MVQVGRGSWLGYKNLATCHFSREFPQIAHSDLSGLNAASTQGDATSSN